MADIKNRIELIREFESAPPSTLLPQIYVAALRGCSEANIARDRGLGRGCPFVRIGNRVFYRKRDILSWLNQHQPVGSTAEARAQARRLREVPNVADRTAASRGA
jgi:hypothetical protein